MAESSRETLTKKAMQVASTRDPSKSISKKQPAGVRNSEAKPILSDLLEAKEVLSKSLAETRDRIKDIEYQKLALHQACNNMPKHIWLPKVICIFSPYNYYDKYVEIIGRLVRDIQSEDESQGLPNLIEALIFEIVCKIDTPVRKPVTYRSVRIQSSNTSYNLPYMSDSFFNTLFNTTTVPTIISIFTHLLCEEKTILVAAN